jgi:hypothetical protein
MSHLCPVCPCSYKLKTQGRTRGVAQMVEDLLRPWVQTPVPPNHHHHYHHLRESLKHHFRHILR